MASERECDRRIFLQDSLRIGALALPAASTLGVHGFVACNPGEGQIAEAAENAESPDLKSIDQVRVVFNEDPWGGFGGLVTAQILRDRVDYLAAAGVDVLAWCTCLPDLCHYPSKVGEWVADPNRRVVPTQGLFWNLVHNERTLVEAGEDPIDVIAERCHRHGMPFVGSVRMNDSHHTQGYSLAFAVTEFFIRHKEWAIHAADGKLVGGMDYAIPQVREHRMAILREQVERYDMDGLELDYLRMAPFFAPGTAERNAPIMTAFVKEIRQMLDEVARAKGRSRLILGARVPTTPASCRSQGLDVETMARDGLLDYLCPSHFHKPDYNLRVEDFVRLANGTNCRIFPTIQSLVTAQYDKGEVLTLDRYRGLANNFFSFGAHGISTFNFMMGKIGTWHVERHRGAWRMMKEMHDPAALKTRDRGYVYDHQVAEDRALVIDRINDVGKRKAVPFRVAEDFSDSSWKRVLRFKPHDLTMLDRLQFDINGVVVTERLKPDFIFLMFDPPNSGRFELDLADAAARFGDNELGVTLLDANPDLKGWTPDYLGYQQTLPVSLIQITELEIVVSRPDTDRGEYGSRYE